MSCNRISVRTKIPYIILLFVTAMCSHYLFHGFLVKDIFICGVLSTYIILRPNSICWMIKAHSHDTYDIMSALPAYIMFSGTIIMGYVLTNYLGIASLDNMTILALSLLSVMFIVIIDRSRYN